MRVRERVTLRPETREPEGLSPEALKALIDVLEGREKLYTAEEAIKKLREED